MEVHQKSDLKLIAQTLSSDLVLCRDLIVNNVPLCRGLKLLLEGHLRDCKLARVAVERLEPWVVIFFERSGIGAATAAFGGANSQAFGYAPPPRGAFPSVAARPHAPPLGDIVTYNWCCPECRSPYPVQTPVELTAQSLLSRILRKPLDHPYAKVDLLWQKSELSIPAQPLDTADSALLFNSMPDSQPPTDEKGHVLTNYEVPSGGCQCSLCGAKTLVGDSVQGCVECAVFVCGACYSTRNTKSLGPLLSGQEERRREANARIHRELCCLMKHASSEGFNLSPVLHFGKLRRQADLGLEMQRLCKRQNGELLQLASPYEYYARAALLHAECGAAPLSPRTRDKRLHEARGALLVALEGFGDPASCRARSQFTAARSRNPHSSNTDGRGPDRPDQAADDPRLRYLLGLILCDLNAFAEARNVYRQVLGRLPMAYFGHVAHFNLACVHVMQKGEAAQAAALRELREFRRHCCSFQGRASRIPSASNVDGTRAASVGGASARCRLCLAPCG